MIDYSKLNKKLRNLRSSYTIDDFKLEITNDNLLGDVISVVMDNTNKWAKSVGLINGEKKEEPDNLSPKERIWNKFFEDHDFKSMENARIWADFISLITDVDANRFIQSSKSKDNFFAPFICIVPTGNPNGHNYQKHYAILSLDGSQRFLKAECEFGNSMTLELSCMRLPTKTEIEDLLSNIFYRSGSYIDRILMGIDEGLG